MTVQDVIEEVYIYLRHRMTQDEYDALATAGVPGLKEAVAQAFYDRCAADGKAGARRQPPEKGNNVHFFCSHQTNDVLTCCHFIFRVHQVLHQ